MNIMRNAINLRLLSATILSVLAPMFLVLSAPTANAAVVYCKYVGVPKGCVARAGVVLRTRATWSSRRWSSRRWSARRLPAAVVATPGVGAPGVGVRPGTPINRGGPVNRVGRR